METPGFYLLWGAIIDKEERAKSMPQGACDTRQTTNFRLLRRQKCYELKDIDKVSLSF